MKNWEYEYIDRDIPEDEGVHERGNFITIKHPAVAALFLDRMVHVKTKSSGVEGEVKLTPNVYRAFLEGKFEVFKVSREEVDRLTSYYHDNNVFARVVMEYGLEPVEIRTFYEWRMGR